MCESSKSERPELESGHFQETDGSGKKVSRRSFLRGMAAGAACLGSGILVGEAIKKLGSEQSQNIPIQHNNERKVPSPGSLSVVVVQLLPENAEPHQGIEKIRSGVRDALGRIALTTSHLYLNVRFTRDGHSPDTTRTTEDGKQPAYGQRLLQAIGQAHARKTRSNMAIVIVDSADTEKDYYAGLTVYDDKQPPVAFVRDVGGVSIGTIAHELGHMLAPEGVKRGLGHAWALQSWVRQDGDKEVKDWRHSPHVAPIQDIIAAGYGLEKDDSGKPNPYASRYSVMGNSALFDSMVDPTIPMFSSPELAFLDPTLSIRHITMPSMGTGQIPISYGGPDRAGITIDIPEDHILRKIAPNADTLFIGPIVRSKQWSNPIDRMGVFATWSGGRDSAILNPSIWDESIKYGENSFEHVAYIDEQLGILVAAGQQSGQVYVRLAPLHTEEAQELIRAGQERLLKSLNI